MEFIRESKIAHILSKSLGEELTINENEILKEWLAESDANRELYKKITNGDFFSEQEEILNHFNRAKGSAKIASKLRKRVVRRVIIASGAAAAVLIVAFVWLRSFSSSEIMPQYTQLEVQSPGVPKVVMSFGNNRILLTEDEQGSEWKRYVKTAANETTDRNIKIEIPRAGEYNLRLSDGTMVWLNSETAIEYPEEFIGDERVVRLRGEAFFEVESDTTKPFIVMFDNARIKVLGTSFNISAYSDDLQATATLVSGKIELSRDGSVVELTPGKQALLKYDTEEIVINNVNTSIYSSWVEGVFAFENMSLEDICRKLSRWYDVDFVFEGTTGSEKFTGGTWKYLPLGEFLAGIEKVTDVQFRYMGDKVIVSKK